MKYDNKITLEWDYNVNINNKYFISQEDWNNTLITKINQINAIRFQYYAERDLIKPDSLLNVPTKFKRIIENNSYYNKNSKILCGRYIVKFINDDINYIEIDGFKIEIINFINVEENMKRNYKLLIIGHMRHGKDTVAGMIEEITGMSFKSSSEMAAEIFIYDELKDKYGYTSFMECFEDRMNHRAEWHDLIKNYNVDDKAKLAKEILKHNDMYVGMRSQAEIDKCIEDGIFDMIIGVYDPNKPLEPKDSFDIDLFASSDFIIPSGDLKVLRRKVEKLCKYMLNDKLLSK